MRRRLAAMRSLGLLELLNKRRGLYRVRVLTDEQVEELEAFLGTRAIIEERQRDVELEQLSNAEWTNEWADADDLTAGVGPEP